MFDALEQAGTAWHELTRGKRSQRAAYEAFRQTLQERHEAIRERQRRHDSEGASGGRPR